LGPRALGCVLLHAQYRAFGRPASMVFYFANPGTTVPTPSECRAVADAYGLWENNGLGEGYSLLRAVDSAFVRANCRSIDPGGGGSFVDTEFSRSGQLPGVIGAMVASGRAPIARWGTAEHGRASARTYLVGLWDGLVDITGDQDTLAPLAGDSISVVLGQLGPMVLATTGYRHVALSVRGVPPPRTLWRKLDITDVGVYDRLGSQRRRARPG
jgi:hypothetical protein